ncbi:MAG: carboxypeptidase regulatory-like domain-containing protein [Verrucomicrobiota bacterium]
MALIFGMMLGLITARGFVVNQNELGNDRHWDLVNLNPSISTNVLNPTTRAIRYFLASDAYSATNTAAELNAIRAAFAQWQAIPGTLLKFEDAGLVTGVTDVNNVDNQNVIFWKRDGTSYFVNGELDNFFGALALTYVSTFDDNTIAEVDTIINGTDYSWFTDFNAGNTFSYFIEASVLHEIGHLIGLAHSPVGGATMLTRGATGVNTQAGLSADEIAAALFLYPKSGVRATLAMLRGRVTINGVAVVGAVITAENSAGNVGGGTVTRADGRYELPALPPGNYLVRATPLDPNAGNSLAYLIRGIDIASSFASALTDFLPTPNTPATLAAGGTTTVDFALASGTPSFRITRLRPPTPDPSSSRVVINVPVTLRLGDSNLFVGVYSPNLPTQNATLTVTGDGLTLGPTIFEPNAIQGLNLMSVAITIASNATPGLRSFVIAQGTSLAYANGFLEILPLIPDFNFDGLDDTFQRKHFPLFTAVEAAPAADPDHDGFTNAREYTAGSDPTDRLSIHFKIQSVKLTANGTTITFESGPGKRYQVFSRRDAADDPWQPVGNPITAMSEATAFFDLSAKDNMRFYRVEALP